MVDDFLALIDLRAPASNAEWNRVLRTARAHGLLPQVAAGLLSSFPGLPPAVATQLHAAQREGRRHAVRLRWEVDRLAQCIGHVQPILLKGAAYAMAGLPPAQGRAAVDVDLMVPRNNLGDVEKGLLANGWHSMKEDDYDQSYYRRWMHELPPMRHEERNSEVDVHHNLLPETSRYRMDPAPLFAASLPLPHAPFRILAPADMILHGAAHMVTDGTFHNALRDLLDLHALRVHFTRENPRFPEELMERAEDLELARPLHYLLILEQRLLENDPCPTAPWDPLFRLTALLMEQTMNGEDPAHWGFRRALAQWLLFVRGHWLRMPLPLLIPHLFKKGVSRVRSERTL